MSFSEAVRTCLSKYAVWKGRAGRAEFWWFNLLGGLITLGIVIAKAFSHRAGTVAFWASIPLLLPSITVLIRRLHDSGRSGWHFWWSLVPLVGGLVLLFDLLEPSDSGRNHYGPEPSTPGVIAPAGSPPAR